MRERRGWFVTLEGPEGSGKSEQAGRLAAAAAGAGLEALVTREPGGTPIGEAIRSIVLARRTSGAAPDPRAEALLFDAARAQLVAEVVAPALDRGALVVCDRFGDSTIAYQGGGHGLDEAALRDVERFATDGLRPDLTILLDVPVDVGLARKAAAERTRFEDLDRDFHERVRATFLGLATEEPGRWVVVDATRPPETVAAAVRAAVARLPGLEVIADLDEPPRPVPTDGVARRVPVIPDAGRRA